MLVEYEKMRLKNTMYSPIYVLKGNARCASIRPSGITRAMFLLPWQKKISQE